MKSTKSFLFMLSLAVGLFTTINSCTKENITTNDEATTEVVTDRNAGPRASGQGSLTAGQWRIFAFNAVTKQDGSVTGQGQLTRTGGGVKIHFSIDCLNVSGNVAVMSGTITNFPNCPDCVGQSCWFKVVDNGEGAGASTDEITFFYYCAPGDEECVLDCDLQESAPLYPIEAGNIQVQD